MHSYKLLSHTADIRMRVEADSLPELFVAAIEGMMNIIKISNSKFLISKIKTKRIIETKSADKTALLVDFMNEVLYQTQKNKEIYNEVKFLEFPAFAEASSDTKALAGKSEMALKAEIYGQKVDKFDEDIKAVTYHEAEIVKNEKGNFETIIVFDI